MASILVNDSHFSNRKMFSFVFTFQCRAIMLLCVAHSS